MRDLTDKERLLEKHCLELLGCMLEPFGDERDWESWTFMGNVPDHASKLDGKRFLRIGVPFSDKDTHYTDTVMWAQENVVPLFITLLQQSRYKPLGKNWVWRWDADIAYRVVNIQINYVDAEWETVYPVEPPQRSAPMVDAMSGLTYGERCNWEEFWGVQRQQFHGGAC